MIGRKFPEYVDWPSLFCADLSWWPTVIIKVTFSASQNYVATYTSAVYVPLSHLRSKETTGQYISYSSPGHYNDIALSTGHYNDIARESCSFELFDLLSDIQTEVELHSLYRRVNSISIVGFSFKV